MSATPSKRRSAGIWAVWADLLFGLVGVQFLLLFSLIIDQKKLEADLKGSPVDIVFVVDVSGSMRGAIEELKRTVISISDVMAKVSPDLRIGVVTYLGKVESTLPLIQVLDPKKHGDHSLQQVASFVNVLKANGGATDLDIALQAGMTMLDGAVPGQRKQVLMLLSDVGCYEQGDISVREPQEIQLEEKLCERLTKWSLSQADRDRRVVCLLPNGANPVSGTLTSHTKVLFERFAQTTRNGVFTETTADMLKAVLEAALAK